jgi:hypothetical protein
MIHGTYNPNLFSFFLIEGHNQLLKKYKIVYTNH